MSSAAKNTEDVITDRRAPEGDLLRPLYQGCIRYPTMHFSASDSICLVGSVYFKVRTVPCLRT